MNDPRQRHDIEDDLIMAVLDGNETDIARLQQELFAIERNTKGRIADLDIF